MNTHKHENKKSMPLHGWLGLGLAILFWALNWTLPGARTHWGFFPLWLGYCLAIDGLVFLRSGTSLLTRSPKKYIGLFLVSAPVWWIFELLNIRTQNWTYLGAEIFTPIQYFFWTTVSFTTVIPAVLGSAEFFASFDFMKRIKRGPIIGTNTKTTASFFTSAGSPSRCSCCTRKFSFRSSGCPFTSFLSRSTSGSRTTPPRALHRERGLDSRACLVGSAFSNHLLWEMWNFYCPSKMDLSRSLCRLVPYLRNAFAWLWRLSTLRAGTVCVVSSRHRVLRQ